MISYFGRGPVNLISKANARIIELLNKKCRKSYLLKLFQQILQTEEQGAEFILDEMATVYEHEGFSYEEAMNDGLMLVSGREL